MVFVFLTALSVLATTVAVWAHETAIDTDKFMETVQPALDDPALHTALRERIDGARFAGRCGGCDCPSVREIRVSAVNGGSPPPFRSGRAPLRQIVAESGAVVLRMPV